MRKQLTSRIYFKALAHAPLHPLHFGEGRAKVFSRI
jgi:hypothetical protein